MRLHVAQSISMLYNTLLWLARMKMFISQLLKQCLIPSHLYSSPSAPLIINYRHENVLHPCNWHGLSGMASLAYNIPLPFPLAQNCHFVQTDMNRSFFLYICRPKLSCNMCDSSWALSPKNWNRNLCIAHTSKILKLILSLQRGLIVLKVTEKSFSWEFWISDW